MEKRELVQKLNILKISTDNNGDEEENHQEADKLLLKFINEEEITKAFNDIRKWYA